MKIYKEEATSEIVTYKIGAYEALGAGMYKLAKEYPKNIKVSQSGNYDTYRIIGTKDEVAPIVRQLRDKGNDVRKIKASDRDIKWYNSQK